MVNVFILCSKMNANPREMIGLTCWGRCENGGEESKREMKLFRVLGLVSLSGGEAESGGLLHFGIRADRTCRQIG